LLIVLLHFVLRVEIAVAQRKDVKVYLYYKDWKVQFSKLKVNVLQLVGLGLVLHILRIV
jgi:hypothetical protein